MHREITILVANNLKRTINTSFDYAGNVGAMVIKDCLERAGYEVGFTDASQAAGKIVLVSITAQASWFDFMRVWLPWQPKGAPQNPLAALSGFRYECSYHP